MRAAIDPVARGAIQLMVARMAIRRPLPQCGRARVTDIIDQVAYEMGLHRADICGHRRHAPLFRARAAICWLARDLTRASLGEIGRIMGGRDHSTVLEACRRAADMRARDPAFVRLTDRLRDHFRDYQED
jgi:chromosomal replication initiation ATPase DnaA